MMEKPSPERLQFGPKEVAYVPLTMIRMLQQMRSAYEEDAIKDLKESLLSEEYEDGEGALTTKDVSMNNAINLARLDRPEAAQYLQDNADYYEIDQDARLTVDQLPWDDTGHTYILIAGHNRDIAMIELAQEHGNDLNFVDASASIFDGITFDKARPLQNRENHYRRPPAVDEANQINREQRYRMRRGESPTVRELASYLGYGESKVRDALAFATLPGRIQSLAADGVLPYTTIRQLEPLARAYSEYHGAHLAEDIPKLVEQELIIVCNKMLSMTLTGNIAMKRTQLIESLRASVLDELATMRSQSEMFQPELFFIEPEDVERRLTTSTRVLKRDAQAVILHLARYGELKTEDIDALEHALNVAKSRQSIALEFTAAAEL